MMRSRAIIVTGVSLAVAAMTPMPAFAQAGIQRPGVEVALFGGRAFFGDFRREGVDPAVPNDELRRTRALPAAVSGFAASYWFSPNWAVRLHASRSRTHLATEIETNGVVIPDPAGAGPETRVRVALADLALVFGIPAWIGGLSPYALVGVGTVRYTGGFEAEPAAIVGGRHRYAMAGGAGAVVPVRGVLQVQVEATTHVSRGPIIENGNDALPNDRDDRFINHIRVTAGLGAAVGWGR